MWGEDAAPEVGRARLQRASNAERNRAAREGPFIREDMVGVWRHVEWFKAETLNIGNLG